MFRKSQRLDRALFDRYFKEGKRYHSSVATIIYSPSSDLKVAVVVGKKVSKSAVKRNLYRRRVYAIMRRNLFSKKTGIYICILKPEVKNLTKNDVEDSLEKLLDKINS